MRKLLRRLSAPQARKQRILGVSLVYVPRAREKWDIPCDSTPRADSKYEKKFLPLVPLPRPRAPQRFFRKKIRQMWFINHNLQVKRRGDFGTLEKPFRGGEHM